MKMPPEETVLEHGKLEGMEALSLEPEEVFVFTRVNGTSSLKEIAQILGYDVARVWRLLLRSVEAGIVVVKGGPAPIGKAKARGTTSILNLLDEEDRDPMISKIPRSRRSEILLRHQAIGKQNHYELLGVKPTSPLEEIKKRYFQLTKEFHPDRLVGVEAPDYKKKLKEIFERINSAYEDLREPIKRESYNRTIRAADSARSAKPKEEVRPETFRSSNLIERLAQAKRYYEMGLREEDAGNGFAAANFYQMSQQYDPEDEATLRALARTMPFVQRKRAEEYYEKAHNALEIHDADLAAELFQKVLDLNPKKKQCYQDLAMLYLKKKSTVSKAKDLMERALKLFAGDVEILALADTVKIELSKQKVK